MSDESMAMSQAIRRAAGFGSTPTDEITAARQRMEQARASGDVAAIEAATRETDEVLDRVQGKGSGPDFGAGAGRPSAPAEESMNDLIRAAAFGHVVRGGGAR